MKVKLLSSLSSINKTYEKDEVIDVTDKQAVRMIKNKLAIPTNKKQYETVIKKLEEAAKQEQEQKRLLEAQFAKEKLETELNALYLEVIEKETLLAGVILEDEEKLKLVEELKNRDTKVVKDETETKK